MKLVLSNPVIHANLADYRAIIYKMILPQNMEQAPTIEEYMRGVSVSAYNPDFGNGLPVDYYTNLHTVQIDWEIEGGYDTCFFGVVYNRQWVADTPVVFTDMHYNGRTGTGMRELVLYHADGVISPEMSPVDVPATHIVVQNSGNIYTSTAPWDYMYNHVHVIEEQPIDTMVKIRLLVGHSNTYTCLSVHKVGDKDTYSFFVPDNYEGSGGDGCGCGGTTIDFGPIFERFNQLDAAVFSVKGDTEAALTTIDNVDYMSNEIHDKLVSGVNLLGTKVDLVGTKVDTVITNVDLKAGEVITHVDAVGTQATALDAKVTSQGTTLGAKVDQANASITSLDGVVKTEAASTRTSVTSESTAVKAKIDGLDFEGVPPHVIDMIMDIHAEAVGSWSWDKREGVLTMLDTNGIEVAKYSVVDSPDVASRERRTDLEVI